MNAFAHDPVVRPPQPAQAAAQAAGQAARTARADAAIAQARADVDAAMAQEARAGVAVEGTQIRTSPDGRTTTIVDASGQRTVISVDQSGQTTIQSGDAPSATLAPGPWSEPIRRLAEAANRRQEAITVADGGAPPFPPHDDIPDEIVPLVGMIFGLIASVIILFPIARALGRRIDRRTAAAAPVPSDFGMRFDRIEQAIETMAVEVERVSEAQRYSARLLTERLPAPTDAVLSNAPAVGRAAIPR